MDCRFTTGLAALRPRSRLVWPWGSALAFCLWFAAGPLRAELLVDADAGVFYDDNLSRAQNSADVRADGAGTALVAARSLFALTGFDTITLGADLRGEAFNRYHGLDNGALGASAVYRHKFGLGYEAPWVMATATAAYYDYQNSLRQGGRF